MRLLLIAAPSALATAVILPAVRRAAGHGGIELVGVVDAEWERPRLGVPLRALAGRLARPARSGAPRAPVLDPLRVVAARERIPHLAPRRRGVNDPAVVRRIAEEIRPDVALSLMTPQLLGPELLAACGGRVVNYHDGLLPAYRGVHATGWSLYNGESRTGFSFHLMSERLDEGPVIVDGAIPVARGSTAAELEAEKAAAAATAVGEALALAAAGDGGWAQRESDGVGYYSRAATAAVTTVDDPGGCRWEDLDLRLRAFGQLDVRLAGRTWPVTALRTVSGSGAALAFTTADGVRAQPRLCADLPVAAYRAYRALRRR